jgi:hypothetical protein
MRQTLSGYGIPLELYADKAGIFFVNTKKQENRTAGEQLAGKTLTKTRFGAIAGNLGIGLISAHTPQAKSRIERLWGTLQDRLPLWFSLNGITRAEQANAALAVFIAGYNAKFAAGPESDDSGREDGRELFLGDTECDSSAGNEWGAWGNKRLYSTD